LAGLGGGCALPVGALATVQDGQLKLEALVASPQGKDVIRVNGCASPAEATALGRELAAQVLERGARALLNG
jgi:hydroxymethylbilane synthase